MFNLINSNTPSTTINFISKSITEIIQNSKSSNFALIFFTGLASVVITRLAIQCYYRKTSQLTPNQNPIPPHISPIKPPPIKPIPVEPIPVEPILAPPATPVILHTPAQQPLPQHVVGGNSALKNAQKASQRAYHLTQYRLNTLLAVQKPLKKNHYLIQANFHRAMAYANY